jgi:hypothetical protein
VFPIPIAARKISFFDNLLQEKTAGGSYLASSRFLHAGLTAADLHQEHSLTALQEASELLSSQVPLSSSSVSFIGGSIIISGIGSIIFSSRLSQLKTAAGSALALSTEWH